MPPPPPPDTYSSSSSSSIPAAGGSDEGRTSEQQQATTTMANRHFQVFLALLFAGWVATEEVSAQDCATVAEPDGRGGCANCTVGTFSSSVDNSSCAPCPAGSFADTGASSCTPCATGLYDHDQRANTTCEYCPIGQFTLADGAQACQSCQDGSRWVRVHGEHGERPAACEVCPVGFFLMGPEIENCHRCPIGSYSPAVLPPGATSSTFCRREDLVLDWMVRVTASLTAFTTRGK